MIDGSENNMVYCKYMRFDDEKRVPGLFYDKKSKTLTVTNEFDGQDKYIQSDGLGGQNLHIYSKSKMATFYLYYKNENELHELGINDIANAEIKNNKNFSVADGIFYQNTGDDMYGIKYIGDMNKKEITIDATKFDNTPIRICEYCFSGTGIEKINTIEDSDHKVYFRNFSLRNMKNLKEITLYYNFNADRYMNIYNYIDCDKSVNLNIITPPSSFSDRVSHANELNNFNEIRVGCLSDETGKIINVIKDEWS